RGSIELDPMGPIFETVVEQRQIAKRAKDDPDAKRRELALKNMANRGAYGIFAEVNVLANSAGAGHVYSDVEFESASLPNERPGRYCNPIIASFVTGSARLLLAMLESEVTRRGGTYALCDTD